MAAEIVLEKNKVEWGPVFAGALAAAALSSVLLAAAASIGLSLISAYPGHSYGKTAGTIAAFWSLIVVIGSFLLGGYIAGRLRSPWGEGRVDEVAFRDGMHEGGRSKPGLPGEPGNKSGPAAKSSVGNGAATGEQGATMPAHDGAPNEGAAAGSDEAKVPGKPGNKSGPAAQPPK